MSRLFTDGGWVLGAILAVSFVAWVLLLRRGFDLLRGSTREELVQGFRAVARGEGARRRARLLERAECRDLRRPLNAIATIATLAPLLGLLGTVLGMIRTFEALGSPGSGTAAAELSAGISQALLTTQVGLVVAVPLLVLHRSLARRLDRRVEEARAAALEAADSPAEDGDV